MALSNYQLIGSVVSFVNCYGGEGVFKGTVSRKSYQDEGTWGDSLGTD
jgi:hypothetical protein